MFRCLNVKMNSFIIPHFLDSQKKKNIIMAEIALLQLKQRNQKRGGSFFCVLSPCDGEGVPERFKIVVRDRLTIVRR